MLRDFQNRVKLGYSALRVNELKEKYQGWNFNSGNYLFTTDTK